MSLFETIEKDYVQAYKAKDAVRLTVLRLLKTAVKNRLVDLCRPGGTLDDAEMLDLIFDNLYVDNNAIYDFGGSMSCLSNSVFNGTEFSSAYASREEKIAADIEKLRTISDD